MWTQISLVMGYMKLPLQKIQEDQEIHEWRLLAIQSNIIETLLNKSIKKNHSMPLK